MEGNASIAGLNFGRYRAIREIGRGATSCVYLAEDEGEQPTADAFGQDGAEGSTKPRRVAVKLVDFSDDRSKLSRRFRKLFATEAAVTAQFDHPNIARVYNWHVEDKRAYLVMELIEGDGLDQFVTMDKLLPMHRVVGIVFKVAMALDYAHRRGIVHRDIKPANVMLTKDDEVKLMDFGLALNIRKNVNVDSTFINGLGSPSYMSPEQIKGYTLNHQTDLYSLGVMFYQLLTGRLPFRAPNTAALVYKIINTEAVPVTQLNPDLPELTTKVIARALEKDLYSRYRLGADMAKDLSAVRFQILRDVDIVPDENKWKNVRALPLLGKLDDVDIWELLRLSAWRVLPPATVIMQDGDGGKSFGFILSGEVEVEKGDRALAKLSRGEIIGEMSFLQSEGGARTASVTTLNEVTYLEINASAFAFATEELVTEIRRLATDAMIERVRAANRVAKRFSPAAVHPTAIPEGEVDAALPAAEASMETSGWSVFSKPALPFAPASAAGDAGRTAKPLIERPAPARTERGSTVVVQPLPPEAAAVIAQMALTHHPRAAQAAALQPFELGPERAGDGGTALPVSEMPADAILTTELGARFDATPEIATTELAGGFLDRANVATTEIGGKLDTPSIATTEMAADFGRIPTSNDPLEAAPEFDVHARTGKSGLIPPGRAPSYAATTEMAADFGMPAMPLSPVQRDGSRPGSLMPPTRPVAEQSTQELAGHFLSGNSAQDPDSTLEMAGGFFHRRSDPMDDLGNDMFPPISPAHANPAVSRGEAADDDEPYEATQMLDPAGYAAPMPTLEPLPDDGPVDRHRPAAGAGHRRVSVPDDDDEPYESTQVLDPAGYSTPLPPLMTVDDDADANGSGTRATATSGDYEVQEVSIEFGSAAHEAFGHSIEGGDGVKPKSGKPAQPTEPFPRLK